MSKNQEKYNLNQLIYENRDKSIRIFKTHIYDSIKYIAVKVYEKKNLKINIHMNMI